MSQCKIWKKNSLPQTSANLSGPSSCPLMMKRSLICHLIPSRHRINQAHCSNLSCNIRQHVTKGSSKGIWCGLHNSSEETERQQTLWITDTNASYSSSGELPQIFHYFAAHCVAWTLGPWVAKSILGVSKSHCTLSKPLYTTLCSWGIFIIRSLLSLNGSIFLGW